MAVGKEKVRKCISGMQTRCQAVVKKCSGYWTGFLHVYSTVDVQYSVNIIWIVPVYIYIINFLSNMSVVTVDDFHH